MGSPQTEDGAADSEGPQHQVVVSTGFYLGRFELTQEQWESVMGTRPWAGESNVQEGERYAAAHTSWNDAQSLVDRLNACADSQVYRLPAEAEWEYACRAGTTTRWSFGDDEADLNDHAWYTDNVQQVGELYPHLVGTKRANPWELHDMHGNVSEWCDDWHREYSRDAQIDPIAPASGRAPTLRGGHFRSWAGGIRSAYREYYHPNTHNEKTGVRLLVQDVDHAEAHAVPLGVEAILETPMVAVGQEVVASARRGVDAEHGEVLEQRWDWEDDGVWDTEWSGLDTVSHAFLEPGTYWLRIQVRDSKGVTGEATAKVAVVSSDELAPRDDIAVELPGGAVMQMVYVPPGLFDMGSPPAESGRSIDEGPQHQVVISRGFYLGKHEVTQQQWESVMDTTPWSGFVSWLPVREDPAHPAVLMPDLGERGIEGFISALNADAGSEVYRLPTEAEWEYACRAGTATRWSFGDEEGMVGDYAWYAGNATDVGEDYAHPVGSKLANPWGLFDMHGNVWELCQGWYGPYPGRPEVDPSGLDSGMEVSFRGGSFAAGAASGRSAVRVSVTPDSGLGGSSFGFRVLRTQ